jgi:hypothetical protein
MKARIFLATAGALAIFLALSHQVTRAQGPLYDRVTVDLPYTVTVGDHVLQPGSYLIRQVDSPGGASRVLTIHSNNGMEFETSALTIPALDPTTRDDTQVVLHHFGSDYYFDKIWIQGKNYGYEFPLPDSVKARQRERMEPVTVAATYQAAAPEPQAAAQAAPPPAPAPAPEPAPETAQAQPAPAPAPEPQAQPAPEPAPEVAQAQPPQPTETANREMPQTSAGWLMMLLSGGLLSGTGMALRRRSR